MPYLSNSCYRYTLTLVQIVKSCPCYRNSLLICLSTSSLKSVFHTAGTVIFFKMYISVSQAGEILPPGANVWRCFWLSQLSECYWPQWVETRNATNILQSTGQSLTTKNYLAQNVSRAKVKRPWFVGHLGGSVI